MKKLIVIFGCLTFVPAALAMSHGGLNPRYKKRAATEIKLLEKKGFTVKNINHETLQEFTVSKDGKEFLVELPEHWPFDPAILNKLKSKVTVETKIIEIIENEFPVDKKLMLVYCHPRPIKLDDKNSHFQVPLFNQYLNENKIVNPHVISLDLREGGTFVADGFSSEFTERNKEMYDLVWLPDCGGAWYELQNHKETEKLIDLIRNVAKTVKPGGALMLGKIMINVHDKIVDSFTERDGFKAKIVKGLKWSEGDHLEPYIEIKKVAH